MGYETATLLRGRLFPYSYRADPCADHRVTLDAHKVRGGRSPHQKFIQVKRNRPLRMVATHGEATKPSVSKRRAAPDTARLTTGTPPPPIPIFLL